VIAMSLDHRGPAASQQWIPTPLRRTGPQRADGASACQTFELLLFATDTALVEEATRAGMDGFIVDWERRGKHRRQAGEGTQINHDTVSDLRRVRATTDATVICRLNGFGWWTPGEVERAIDAGADEVLLPMVRSTDEVDRTLEMVSDRCGLGILVETRHGVRATPELGTRPLSRVYVGLNDLRIDRGSNELFEPLVDGTVEQVRSHVGRPRFGVAGLTLPDRGAPVPSRLLAAELSRIGADFTFLRRSFLADTGGRQLTSAVRAIRADLVELAARTPAQELADRQALLGLVRRSAVHSA
jgi:hypothetical protein